MKAAPRLALVALVASTPLALHAAEVASTNLSVTATVLASCVVSAPTGLVFASANTGDRARHAGGAGAVEIRSDAGGIGLDHRAV